MATIGEERFMSTVASSLYKMSVAMEKMAESVSNIEKTLKSADAQEQEDPRTFVVPMSAVVPDKDDGDSPVGA